jgi:hypothetical protein
MAVCRIDSERAACARQAVALSGSLQQVEQAVEGLGGRLAAAQSHYFVAITPALGGT